MMEGLWKYPPPPPWVFLISAVLHFIYYSLSGCKKKKKKVAAFVHWSVLALPSLWEACLGACSSPALLSSLSHPGRAFGRSWLAGRLNLVFILDWISCFQAAPFVLLFGHCRAFVFTAAGSVLSFKVYFLPSGCRHIFVFFFFPCGI